MSTTPPCGRCEGEASTHGVVTVLFHGVLVPARRILLSYTRTTWRTFARPSAEVWAAAALLLARLRRAYLAGDELPLVLGMAPAVLRLAVFTDVTAGDGGILGQSMNDADSGGGGGSGGTEPPQAPRGPAPRPEPLPALPDAYVGFLRGGGLALCVKRALEGPTAALTGPVAGGVTLGGAEPVDFGLQRCRAAVAAAGATLAGGGGGVNDAWWGEDLWGGGGGGGLWAGVGAAAGSSAAAAATAAAPPMRTRGLTITNKAGTSKSCPPRHPTHFEPWFFELTTILRRGEQYLPGPTARGPAPRCCWHSPRRRSFPPRSGCGETTRG